MLISNLLIVRIGPYTKALPSFDLKNVLVHVEININYN